MVPALFHVAPRPPTPSATVKTWPSVTATRFNALIREEPDLEVVGDQNG